MKTNELEEKLKILRLLEKALLVALRDPEMGKTMLQGYQREIRYTQDKMRSVAVETENKKGR